MTLSPPEAPLLQALAITRTMLAAAQAGDWQQLSALEATREPLLHRQHPADAASHAQLGEVLAYDRELQALVGQARDDAARQWQRENGRAQAIAAYGQS
ncbi:flagellar protein FliT [Rhodanobacter umsongensis]|uniref:Flagellar protein FliT n=1 Tax=Rhodanobacter umsongensis TaxID=633153 RepID=A0ABW0JL77_9GAMM